jgi:alanine-glyoxylate transaminase/serine-glyoxylate transaminase/serine-pyruvate transaminase
MSLQNPVFIPGPTNIPENLAQGLRHADVDHRSSAFGTSCTPHATVCGRSLKSPKGRGLHLPRHRHRRLGNAITNTLSRATRFSRPATACSPIAGSTCASATGSTVEVVETPWGDGLPADRYEEILRADKAHRSRRCSPPTTKPRRACARTSPPCARRLTPRPPCAAVRRRRVLHRLDGFPLRRWGVDVAVTGSQKGFMLPAGLAIVGFSEKRDGGGGDRRLPRTFFDIRDMAKATPPTRLSLHAAVGLLNGLNQPAR